MQGANHLQYEQVRGMRCLFFKIRFNYETGLWYGKRHLIS